MSGLHELGSFMRTSGIIIERGHVNQLMVHTQLPHPSPTPSLDSEELVCEAM